VATNGVAFMRGGHLLHFWLLCEFCRAILAKHQNAAAAGGKKFKACGTKAFKTKP